MMKVKISSFLSIAGAQAFASLRFACSTACEQGRNLLTARSNHSRRAQEHMSRPIFT